MVPRIIFKQYRKPHGIFGRLVGQRMARSNYRMSEWTIDLLDLSISDHILEIGFGPGIAIDLASKKITDGSIAGIDISKTMLKAATRRNCKAIKSGRVDLRFGSASSLPYSENSFLKVFAIHCIYFWTDPKTVLKKIYSILHPGGLIAITIMPKSKWSDAISPPADLFSLYSSQEIEELLKESGFVDPRIEIFPRQDLFPGECIIGNAK